MLKAIIDRLIHYDRSVWYRINARWHNSFFDSIMPLFRNPWFWSPLYLFLLIFIPYKYGRRGWMWCGTYLVTFILSDQVSATLMKPWFHRLRPCNDATLAEALHRLVPCGSGYSFPSSHAANHFSMAIFVAMTLGRHAKWVWPVAIGWAALVCYSQVYVGVHFPLDVACGGLLGSMIGYITGRLNNRYFLLELGIRN